MGCILVLMSNTTKVLTLYPGDQEILESWLRVRTLPRRLLERVRIVLAASEGMSRRMIAEEVGVAKATATLWIERYEAEGIPGIEQDRPRSGRPRKMTRELEERIIEKTVTESPPPEVATHWSTRLMATATGLTREDIGRTWRKYGLKPHQIKRFKLSRDPRLVEKIHDVVGLYLDPPTHAVVFSFDEKSQMQALDRTQPGLPLKKGRAGTMTHDYKRYGTTTLFAALNVATGEVVHECMPRHRHQEFLKFLRKIDATVQLGLDVHVILDNYATHKHAKVRAWLRRHPRVHLHFIPTGSSWLNMVERLFSELTEKQLRRLAVTSVPQLVSAVTDFIEHRNEAPRPYIWTKSAKDIIEKIERGLRTFESLH
jgi:transposase